MQTRSIQLTDVIYNAANQSFEALVSVENGGDMRKYACAINAPINMSFEDAADRLAQKALRLHDAKCGTYSHVKRHTSPQRTERAAFDPVRWLESLIHLPGRRAA